MSESVRSSPLSLLPAGLGRRLCALCYEILLLIAVVLVLGGIFQLVFPAVSDSPLLKLGLFLYEVILVFVYFAFCWVRGGQTLAMKTWRMMLRKHDGQCISIGRALLRYLILLAVFLPAIPVWVWAWHGLLPHHVIWLASGWVALPYLWALVDKDRQFLHDRLIGAVLWLAPRKNQAK